MSHCIMQAVGDVFWPHNVSWIKSQAPQKSQQQLSASPPKCKADVVPMVLGLAAQENPRYLTERPVGQVTFRFLEATWAMSAVAPWDGRRRRESALVARAGRKETQLRYLMRILLAGLVASMVAIGGCAGMSETEPRTLLHKWGRWGRRWSSHRGARRQCRNGRGHRGWSRPGGRFSPW